MAAGPGTLSRSRRVVRHLRNPSTLPALLRANVTLLGRSVQHALAVRRPGHWTQLGHRLATGGRYQEALACYDRALALKGDIPRGLINRGTALRHLDRPDEAEISLREALRLKPDSAEAHHELGNLLDDVGRFEEAEASVRTAVRFEPENASAHADLGHILYHLGHAAESEASYRTALSFRPNRPEWHAGLGLALLMAEQLEDGWREFEWRWRSGHLIRRNWPVPSWSGEAIGDRPILLASDQGQGDALQFCRYIPQVTAGSGKTILTVQPPLIRLLSRLPGVSEAIPQRRPSSADLWCAFMSLPHAVGPRLQDIPAPPYLTADPADVARWRERLADLAGLRVGLCWAGGQSPFLTKINANRRRSIALEMLAPLGEIAGVRFISLQKGPQAAEAAHPPPGMELHDFTADLHDFADTAALIENLDLVISVDTSVAHLAGALDKPVWVLNRFDTDWRWPRDHDGTPWYPSARQFRQPTPGDWVTVIRDAQVALRRHARGTTVR